MASTVGQRKRASAGQGPNLEPLKELLDAKSIYSQKDPAAEKVVLDKLAKAIGITEPSALVKDNLDKVFDNKSMLSDSTLRLVLAETKKRRV